MSQDKTLQLVTLVGSLRKQSYNASLARQLSKLAPEGVNISALGSIGDIPHYNSDVQDKGFPESVTQMAEAIAKADGVIIVTPEYNYSVPGVLKNSLDWLSRLPNQPFAAKPLTIYTVSPGAIGGARAQYHLRQMLVFLDARVLNKPEVMIGEAMKKFDETTLELTDGKTREFITKQLSAFSAFIRG